MKRTFTKYPSDYVKADTNRGSGYYDTLFDVSHTDSSGNRVTGQLYTADKVSRRLQDLLSWGCTDITVTEYKGRR